MPDYELEIEGFRGPLHKLLELIENRKMEISRVSLGAVTGDFLGYIGRLESVAPQVIADFISVAAKLVLLKSMLLLPSNIFNEEDEKEAADLELRLSLYKQFKAAERHLRNAWSGHEMFTRPFLRNIEPGFYLSQAILPEQLLLAVKKVYSDAAVFSPAAEKREISVESLEEKMRKLAERITIAIRSSFSELTKDADRGELVAVFLALLHLLKDNAINIRQDDIFSEMIIEKV